MAAFHDLIAGIQEITGIASVRHKRFNGTVPEIAAAGRGILQRQYIQRIIQILLGIGNCASNLGCALQSQQRRSCSVRLIQPFTIVEVFWMAIFCYAESICGCLLYTSRCV